MVYTITRQPRNLLAHLQRNYALLREKQRSSIVCCPDRFVCCFRGAGDAIKQRMLVGARKHLSLSLFGQLQTYLNASPLIQGNIYTVLTSGLVLHNDAVNSLKHDPLQIARDYIEYSQLEEAVQVLEAAILETPAQ